MFTDNNPYIDQFEDLIRNSAIHISTIKPSDWVERNVVMGDPFPGPYRYSKTPYCRKIIDCLAPDHPARWIAFMKGLQVGASSGVILPGLAYIMSQAPGNTYFTVGAPDLIEEAGIKLDLVIDRAGIRNLIKPQVQRKRAVLTGDKSQKKDFPGGYIKITSANNHKNWRDVSLKYGFFDDFEAIKAASNQSGSTKKLIEGRFAAYKDVMKQFYISTAELEEGSNILPAFNLGNREYYFIDCPCCHTPIMIDWEFSEGQIVNPLTNDMAAGKGGIYFEQSNHGHLIESSVGYICYKCSGFFKDNKKDKLLNEADWIPTAEASKPGYFSFHLSSLYAPSGMYDWKHYVNNYIECNPVGQPRLEAEYKTFVNTCLGRTYKPPAETTSSAVIEMNIRKYAIGTLPEKQSIADGNGKIVLVTCGSDLNGLHSSRGGIDDARLDFELVAHTESGATYSFLHGSIGTFIPRQGDKVTDRVKWTYEFNMPNSVWPEFEKLLGTTFDTGTGRKMPIAYTALDCGAYATVGAYPFLNYTNHNVIGVKGEKEDKYQMQSKDARLYKKSLERPNDMYILQVGLYKDRLNGYMALKWDRDGAQPSNFMNFPERSGGLYEKDNFFEHYESEHRTMIKDKDGALLYRWVKKNTGVQNHMFDCRIYNLAIVDIALSQMAEQWGVKNLTWQEFVEAALQHLK